ncbi:hypothetical protein FB451DRAFT_1393306 [Mycena latifolia]|nr:hypothetical protein FB451DRAFT_1393306 [Mycena latifolia]
MENRFIGVNSRGCYEYPQLRHVDLEGPTLDRARNRESIVSAFPGHELEHHKLYKDNVVIARGL